MRSHHVQGKQYLCQLVQVRTELCTLRAYHLVSLRHNLRVFTYLSEVLHRLRYLRARRELFLEVVSFFDYGYQVVKLLQLQIHLLPKLLIYHKRVPRAGVLKHNLVLESAQQIFVGGLVLRLAF